MIYVIDKNYIVMEKFPFPLKFQHYTGGEGKINCLKSLKHYFERLTLFLCILRINKISDFFNIVGNSHKRNILPEGKFAGSKLRYLLGRLWHFWYLNVGFQDCRYAQGS